MPELTERLADASKQKLRTVQEYFSLAGKALRFAFVRPFYAQDLVQQMDEIGVKSLGIVLLTCGGVLALTCISLFVVRGRGTPAPFDPPRVFVAVGPYTLVRNPMYVGGWLMLAGLGLWLRSPAIVLFSTLWLAAAHLFVVMYEERTLRKTFDGSYERYVQTVLRWLPTQTSRT